MAGMIADASDDDLARYAAAIKSEQDRRRIARNAEQQVAELNVAYLAATGTEPGQAWRQPTGAHDAYQKGDLVTFEGAVYESTIDGNTWSPTDYPAGWSLKGGEDGATGQEA